MKVGNARLRADSWELIAYLRERSWNLYENKRCHVSGKQTLDCGSGACGAAAFASAAAPSPRSQGPLCQSQHQKSPERTGNVYENKGH
jgi:hypothetical protein